MWHAAQAASCPLGRSCNEGWSNWALPRRVRPCKPELRALGPDSALLPGLLRCTTIHALVTAGLNCGRWDYMFSFIKTMRRCEGGTTHHCLLLLAAATAAAAAAAAPDAGCCRCHHRRRCMLRMQHTSSRCPSIPTLCRSDHSGTLPDHVCCLPCFSSLFLTMPVFTP